MPQVTLPSGHTLSYELDDFTNPWAAQPETVVFVHIRQRANCSEKHQIVAHS